MNRQGDVKFLEGWVPSGSISLVSDWLFQDPVHLRISKPRNSKLGDFRPAQKGNSARISINTDLHPVEFIITLAHEFAHAEVYNMHGRRAKPHGKEWKSSFRKKLSEIIRAGILEERFTEAIIECYFKRNRLATSSCSGIRRLLDVENEGSGATRLEDIPQGSAFKISSGKVLVKGEKIRTRYRCREIGSKRIYTVHPMTEILEFKPPEL